MKRQFWLSVTAVWLVCLLLGGCLLNTGCALNVKHENNLTNLDWRVGVQEMTIIDGKMSLPTDIHIDIGSDLAVLAIDATVGGGVLRSVVEGVEAFHNWVWGVK